MTLETSPSGKTFQRDEASKNPFYVAQEAMRQEGYKHYATSLSPEVKDAYTRQYERFKETLGWHTGGYCEYWPEGPRRVQALASHYLGALLSLEEMCRTIALKGEGRLPNAVRQKMYQLGLLRRVEI